MVTTTTEKDEGMFFWVIVLVLFVVGFVFISFLFKKISIHSLIPEVHFVSASSRSALIPSRTLFTIAQVAISFWANVPK
jgi:hypothetical protein